jgi:hypothetical protein
VLREVADVVEDRLGRRADRGRRIERLHGADNGLRALS